MLTGMPPRTHNGARTHESSRRDGNGTDRRSANKRESSDLVGSAPSPDSPLDLPRGMEPSLPSLHPLLDVPVASYSHRGDRYRTVVDQASDLRLPSRAMAQAKDVMSLMDDGWFGNEELSHEQRITTNSGGTPWLANKDRHVDSHRTAASNIDGSVSTKRGELRETQAQPGGDVAGLRRDASARRATSNGLPPMAPPAPQRQPSDPPTPGLGTWTQRQTVFARQPQESARRPNEPDPAAAPALDQQPAAGAAAAAAGVAADVVVSSGSFDEEAVRAAAWKWRFGRRWAAEQEKAFDPTYGQDGNDEEWDEALRYLHACGNGWNFQLGRTSSLDKSLPASLTLGQSLNFSGPVALTLNEETYQGNQLEKAELAATREIASIAKKAQALMAQQSAIEHNVAQRLSTANNGRWAGAYLSTVDIDSWGRFVYALVRVNDQGGHHKMVVRGKNFSNEGKLVEQVRQELASVCAERGVGHVAVHLVGSGVMEWSRDRDRRLKVMEGRVVRGSDASITTESDVAQLACALTRGNLPMNYQVIVQCASAG